MAYYYVHGNSRYKWKPSFGKEESKFINEETGIDFKNSSQIKLTPVEYFTDTLFEVWNITDHIHIPRKKYDMFSPDIEFTLPQKANYTGTGLIKWGDFYGGKIISFNISPTYIFNKHFRVALYYEYDHIQFPAEFSDNGNGLFQNNLVRLNISYFFSSKVSIKLLTQLDDLSNQVTSNLRFRYNPKEGTDLYIVFNQGLNTDRTRLEPHLPVIDTQVFTVKFIKTFDMR